QIRQTLRRAEFDVQLAAVSFFARRFLRNLLSLEPFPDSLGRRPVVFVEWRVGVGGNRLQRRSGKRQTFIPFPHLIPVDATCLPPCQHIERTIVRPFLNQRIADGLWLLQQMKAARRKGSLQRNSPSELPGLLEDDHAATRG